MNNQYRNRLTLRAQAMSSLEIWPAGDYSEHLPTGSSAQRLGQYWSNTGRYLVKAVSTIKEDRTYDRQGTKIKARE